MTQARDPEPARESVDQGDPARLRPSATTGTDDGRCFLCGRPFHPTRGEPIRGGDDVLLCVGCGILYELPDCCA